MDDEPFMPIAHPSADTKIETTFGVLGGLRKQIAQRDQRIADLLADHLGGSALKRIEELERRVAELDQRTFGLRAF